MRYLVLVLLAVATLTAGCTSKPTGTPEQRAVRDVQRIYDLIWEQDWKELWKYVHPDIQEPITYEYFADAYTEYAKVSDLADRTPTRARSAEKLGVPWSNWGKQYDNVYAVTIDVDSGQYGTISDIERVVEVRGRFRYFPSLIALNQLPQDNESNSPAARAAKDGQRTLDLQHDGRWQQLWEYVHPDEQVRAGYERFSEFYEEWSAASDGRTREVTWVVGLDTPWRHPPTGKEYDDVYKVWYKLGGTTTIYPMHMVEVDGRFRIFLSLQ